MGSPVWPRNEQQARCGGGARETGTKNSREAENYSIRLRLSYCCGGVFCCCINVQQFLICKYAAVENCKRQTLSSHSGGDYSEVQSFLSLRGRSWCCLAQFRKSTTEKWKCCKKLCSQNPPRRGRETETEDSVF